MSRSIAVFCFCLLALASAACASSDDPPGGPPQDSGMDARADSGTDAGYDSGRDAGADANRSTAVDSGTDANTGPRTVASCYDDTFHGDRPIGPDYDQFHPVVGSHCLGTNHQRIEGVERVVFLGDSVTVGTPPTLSGDYYRTQVAEALADRFGLDKGISFQFDLWSFHDHNGVALVRESGDFANCAKWGARTDDLAYDGGSTHQMRDCFPEDKRNKRTLVIMTMGGNDISNITQRGIDGDPIEDIWVQTRAFVQLMRDAVDWMKAPGRFPNGIYIVFANMFEFTDGTGEVEACPAAGLAGFGADWEDPSALAAMVIYANEQFARIATETQTDMIFMLEEFCGHGYNNENPSAPCYRGPGTPRFFDDTCIHPNPAGHEHIADMFISVVGE